MGKHLFLPRITYLSVLFRRTFMFGCAIFLLILVIIIVSSVYILQSKNKQYTSIGILKDIPCFLPHLIKITIFFNSSFYNNNNNSSNNNRNNSYRTFHIDSFNYIRFVYEFLFNIQLTFRIHSTTLSINI